MSERRGWSGLNCARVILLAASIGWIGCAPSSEADSQLGAAAAGDNAGPPIALEVVDRAAFDAVVAKLRGQVVLVDTWATWCRPCMEQLPHSVALSDRYRDRGLAVVTLSMDEPEDLEPIRAALRAKRAAQLTNLVSKFGGSTQSVEAFEVPGGALPHYKLYDRSGKLAQTFVIDPSAEHQFTPAEIEAAVVGLLAE